MYPHRLGPEDWGQSGEGAGPNQCTHKKIRTKIQVWGSGQFDGTFSTKVTKLIRRNKTVYCAQGNFGAVTKHVLFCFT